MFRNYFTIACRNFWRNKVFSLINIAGLAIGISASLVIYLIVQHEFSYDNFHKDPDRIYRVVSEISFPDLTIRSGGIPVPTYKAIKEEVNGVELVTHMVTPSVFNVSVPFAGSETPAVFRKQKQIIYTDHEYFDIFRHEWLAGSSQTALKDPFQVVLTESRATNYFGKTAFNDIVGREIIYDDSIHAKVSGIVKDYPVTSDFDFKEYISRATVEVTGVKNHWSWDEWGSINSSSIVFVKLAKATTTAQVERQLVTLRNKYRTRRDDRPKDDTKHSLQPLKDIHFNGEYDAMGERQANKTTLYGLLAVAGFLLLLGCINFINLTTAQSAQRAKEIGIRKTMGSGAKQLMMQFLGETFLLTLLATILCIFITPWLLTIFSDFIPPGISFASLNQAHVWLFLLALMLTVSVLAGLYPAMVLTKFKPVTVLKNQVHSGTAQTRKAWLRKSLTVTQFVIAQFLIIATLVVSKQIHYSLNKDLGYKKEAIVSIDVPWNFFDTKEDKRHFVLFDKLKLIPEIERVSLAGSTPASNNVSSTTMKYDNGKKVIETMVEVKYIDTNYFDVFGMKLLAGKNLHASDTTKEYVINETYAKFLGFKKPEDAIGKTIERNFHVPIVAVVADFHAKSTHVAIKPLAFSAAARNTHTLHIALKPRTTDAEIWNRGLKKIEKEFKTLFPEEEFKYDFFDERIASFYKAEQDISTLLTWSAGLCIFISCLGLLGLVIYTTNMRTKEIGVRKVLGASIVQVIALLSKDFISLVLVAFLIAAPIAWWVMHNWLQDFVYRTNLSWWLFAASGMGMILLAIITLSLRTIRSASVNPVTSLRSE